jgi:hypothetical protein
MKLEELHKVLGKKKRSYDNRYIEKFKLEKKGGA